MKDYYKILEVTPTASVDEIKRSYRRLALRYHPDKNFGTEMSEAKFKEIQEAYRILSDTRRRNDYNYSRPAGFAHAARKKPAAPQTPQTLLLQAADFRKKILLLDPERMNKLAVYQQIQHILSAQNIAILQQYNDASINKKIIEEMMLCSRYLPFVFVEKICFQLAALAGTDNALYQKIYKFSKHVRLQTYWNKYKVVAGVIASLILCFVIYLLSTGF